MSGFEDFHQQQGGVGGYQVQEDEQQQQYYPHEQQHYQYVPQEQPEQGLSHYYSYPQGAGGFHHQPIVVDEQEKS